MLFRAGFSWALHNIFFTLSVICFDLSLVNCIEKYELSIRILEKMEIMKPFPSRSLHTELLSDNQEK